jgi:uncharacterized membrane protein YadS
VADPTPPPAQTSHGPLKVLLAALVLVCLAPRALAPVTFLVAPPVALLLGVAFGVALGNPWSKTTSAWSKKLLQVAVIGLGFGLDAREVLLTARDAIPVTLLGIVLTFALGAGLARLVGADGPTSFLVTTGTAICGGSAIAAMAPVVEADEKQTGVSLATIFTLNAIALLLFPPLGQALGLTAPAFGAWGALAIHDTSSVVGAATAYDAMLATSAGATAVGVGTTTKLARALWILPLVLTVAWWRKSDKRAPFPLFLLGFVAAVALRAALPSLQPVWSAAYLLAKQVLVVTLLLIGLGLTRDTLKKLGARPLIHGVVLWIIVGAASLGFVLAGWVPLGATPR